MTLLLPTVSLDVPTTLLRRALDAATTGLAIVDVQEPDQPVVWTNIAFATLTGYAPEEILGRNCRLLQGPGTDSRTVAEVAAAVGAGRELRTRLLNYRRDGSTWWNELHLCPMVADAGELTHYLGVLTDVTTQVQAETAVLHLAYHDALTGLANRRRLAEATAAALGRGRVTGAGTALLFLDLDNFKEVNDTHGHEAGDELLLLVARRLLGSVRAGDLLARQGGDEFLLLLSDLPGPGAREFAGRVAGQLLDALVEPFAVRGRRHRVGASIGLALAPTDGETVEDLLRCADTAMYAAKNAGGRRYRRCAG